MNPAIKTSVTWSICVLAYIVLIVLLVASKTPAPEVNIVDAEGKQLCMIITGTGCTASITGTGKCSNIQATITKCT